MKKFLKSISAGGMSLALVLAFAPAVPVALAEDGQAAVAQTGEVQTLEDGTYSATVISSYNMFPVEKDATIVVKGSVPYAIVTGPDGTHMDQGTNSPKFDALWLGDDYANLPDCSTSDVVTGIPVYGDAIAEGDAKTYNDGSGKRINAYKFVMPTTFDALNGNGIGYVARYASHYSGSKPGQWSGTSLKHFTFTDITKVSSSTEVPGETVTELPNITNKERMFKFVNAKVDKVAYGSTYLEFSLSGDGYEYVIPGTYWDVLAAQKGANKDNWVKYALSDDGKYTFRVPVTLDSTGKATVPFVAVSKKNAATAETSNPSNPDYSKAFTARQADIDLGAGSITTGNCSGTVEAAVTTDLAGFSVLPKGLIHYYGIENDNNFQLNLTMTLNDAVYDKAFVGTSDQAAQAAADSTQADQIAEIKPNTAFELKFANTKSIKTIKNGSAIASFHNKIADTWVERAFAVDVSRATIAVSGSEDPAVAASMAVDQIDSLPATVALSDAAAVKEARAAYDALTPEQRALVPAAALSKLAGAEARIAQLSRPAAKKVTTVTINSKTVTSKAVKRAIGENARTVTTVVLGKKVKTVRSKAFKGTKVRTLVVKSKKLTKKSVRGSLKSSKVRTVKVSIGSKKTNRRYAKGYKKIFTKKVAGKKARVK